MFKKEPLEEKALESHRMMRDYATAIGMTIRDFLN